MWSRRSWLAVAGLAMLCACGVDPQASPQMARDGAVPFQLLNPSATTLVPYANGPGSEAVSLCFVQNHNLVVVQQQLPAPVALSDVVDALSEPPQQTPDLRTALGGDKVVHDVALQAGVVRVDLESTVAALGGDNQLLAIGQLVCTLTSRPGVGQVAFTLSGAPVDVPRADGSLTLNPVARDDYVALMAGAA